MNYTTLKTPIGQIRIAATDRGISEVHFHANKPISRRSSTRERHPILAQAQEALSDYFSGHTLSFSLPLDLQGTPFQQLVWKELLRIPYGKTRTYGEIAQRIGKPKAARAVGMACNRNPVGILIPCHRVIGANGDLTGYAGGLKAKQALLKLEQRLNG